MRRLLLRRLLLTAYGVAVAFGYAAVLHLVNSSPSSILPFRGLFLILFIVWYAWFFSKDTSISTGRFLIEVPLIPIALIGAIIAGVIFLASAAATKLNSLWDKHPRASHDRG